MRLPLTRTVHAALAVVAPLLGAGEVQMFAQRVEQRCPRIHLELPRTTVDPQHDRREIERLVPAPFGLGRGRAGRTG